MIELNELAEHVMTEFGSKYRMAKGSQKDLEKAQKRLFVAFDALLKKESRPRRSVLVPEDQEIEVFCQSYHSGWRIESVEGRNVILIQDESLMAYTYVNPVDEYVYGRDAMEGSPSLDDERLRAEDPLLWERLTMWPEPLYSLLRGIMAKYTPERYNDIDGMVDEYLREQNVIRTLAPQDRWSHEDVALLEDYIIPGQVKVRLRPPRKAKAEELNI